MSHTAANREEEGHGVRGAGWVRGVRPPRPVRKIGRVEELFLGGEGEPEYVRVRIGPFGLKSAFIR